MLTIQKTRMKTKLYSRGIAIGIAFALASLAQASPILTLFNTGLFANGTLEPNGTVGDGNYVLFSVPSGTTTLRAGTSAGGFPIPPWVGDDTLSRWIGPNNPTFNDVPGQYDYRTTFSLAGFIPGTASLAGRWASDNIGVDILINGLPTGTTVLDPGVNCTPCSTFSNFSITTGFAPGINTLDFIVRNLGTTPNPTGLRVEITGNATPFAAPVPEPSSLVLFGAGLVGLVLMRKKSVSLAMSHRAERA